MSKSLSKRSFVSSGSRRVAWIAICFSAACASAARPPEMHTSVRVEPASSGSTSAASSAPVVQSAAAAPKPAMPDLPALPSRGPGPALAAAPERRLLEVNIPPGTPIATAVAQIGHEYGLSVAVDPDVKGTVQANLRNVSLTDALDHIVPLNHARYQVQGGVLRVVPIRMEMRTFTLDYVALSRVGTMSTVVQRRLSNNSDQFIPGASASSAANLNANAGDGDVLMAQSISDVWSDIRVALTGIMHAGQPMTAQTEENAAAAPTAPTPAAGALGASTFGSGPQASSTSFADGSALIISPSAGLITVTAMPDKIAAVERYIADFQASVLRQVMIAAKIVEVKLDKEAHFGIDWSVVTGAASKSFGVTLRSDSSTVSTGNAGNINFTFTGGTTTINAVLTALESQGDVRVLSNEQTSALNNQRAIFQVTSDEVFFSVSRTPLIGPNGSVISLQSSVIPQQVSVGVVLDVLPQISADNILTMDIRPAVTNVTSVATVSLSDGTQASAPNIARREGDTIARLRAGETMMIGGLVQSRTDKTVSGIPVLKDIPFLGKAFQHVDNVESRSELVVFLTPTIITGQPVVGR
jgi:MSHA type pilus biogenesis protein MshL